MNKPIAPAPRASNDQFCGARGDRKLGRDGAGSAASGERKHARAPSNGHGDQRMRKQLARLVAQIDWMTQRIQQRRQAVGENDGEQEIDDDRAPCDAKANSCMRRPAMIASAPDLASDKPTQHTGEADRNQDQSDALEQVVAPVRTPNERRAGTRVVLKQVVEHRRLAALHRGANDDDRHHERG